jgi:Kef-type K+ transport system membrane component KefB
MFLAGIEIDMYHLRKNLRKGMTFGLFTFIIPLILGALVAMAALRMHFLEATLLASMFAAHTLIAYPIVTRFGVTKSPAVVIAIAGTIVTVLGSLIVLAGVLGVYRDGSVVSLIPVLCYLALYCVGLIYIYPRVTRYFFKHYSDGIAQFIYVMVMVFGAAALASFIGLEGVFGAFFAGLVLNRFIPARSPLMGRLEFVGNAIFIPYFLIGVGMLIDLHVVMDGWTTLYTAAVMSAVAMLSKWIAAWVTQKVYRLTPVDRSIMYQLSNAHTAVALAVVMIGYEMHLFDVTVLNGTVVMILVTCTVSSFGTERAASRLKVQLLEQADEDSVRDDATTHPRTLVAISNPLTAPSIVDLALSMRFPDTSVAGDLYALHVRNDNSASSKAIGRNSLDVAERAASAVETNLTAIERFDLNFITGVLNTMEERDITELVLGIHRRTSIIDSFLGEKIEQLLRSTNRMVVMSRCFIPLATVTRILVAVPKKAQFETGFRRWVQAVGNLGRQVGCRVEFWCEDSTAPLIRTVITQSKLGIRMSFSTVESYDDFVIKSSEINDDDLLIVVSARRSSVSFDSDMDAVPEYLQKYLAGNNLIVIYPGQFGTEPPMTMAETMATDIVSPPNPVFLFAMNQLRRLRKMLRKASGRK